MSLNRRIILSATLVLVIFITLTAATLEKAFVDSSESALHDTLTSQLYALMAVAEVEGNNVQLPSDELDALLGLPSSGIYAYITDTTGKILWRSSSALGANPPSPVTLASGEQRFFRSSVEKTDYYTFAYGVDWSSSTDDIDLTFNIITDLNSFDKQIDRYRHTLWSWLITMAVFLLLSQAFILRWGLSPLRKVGEELNRIEIGEQEKIEDRYPREIEQLSNNINILLLQEREQKTRYRNALGDLAHSLKTPLAVIQSAISDRDDQDRALSEQVIRMNSIVEYQLQRAATAGSSSIGKSVNVMSVLDRILDSLNKVYHEKSIHIDTDVDASIIFRGDEGDLMEVLGNLLDNAFKWSNRLITIKVKQETQRLHISISDDGPGIAQEKVEALLQRGKRADQNVAGHGIGLSIVNTIITAYHGSLTLDKSETGGLRVSFSL
ncbi:MAG TPA: GHKL domain-containing protein [Gammaproteobacteria bacterium]|nr:GHKL domain-containing protein [Gammaproteobacteria bacterium]